MKQSNYDDARDNKRDKIKTVRTTVKMRRMMLVIMNMIQTNYSMMLMTMKTTNSKLGKLQVKMKMMMLVMVILDNKKECCE